MRERLRHEVLLAAVALQFLTRWPVRLPVRAAERASGPASSSSSSNPAWDERWLGECVRHFPAVGALIGLAVGTVAWGAALLWPPTLAALLAVAAGVWWTGAFHEDGLADTFDALGGSVDRERALTIMKDSRIGTYGAIALILVSIGRVSALAALLSISPGLGLAACVWMHALARWVCVLTMAALPYGGDAVHAKAKPLALGVSQRQGWLAALWLIPAALPLVWLDPTDSGGVAVLACLFAALALAAGMRRWVVKRLGGYTGDTLGAAEQLAELASGLILVALLAPLS